VLDHKKGREIVDVHDLDSVPPKLQGHVIAKEEDRTRPG
jgi:hypothetical protein